MEPGPTPRDLSNDQADLTPGVLFDDVPPFTRFGDVYEDADPSYDRGEVVQVVFWGAHPRNNLRIQDTTPANPAPSP